MVFNLDKYIPKKAKADVQERKWEPQEGSGTNQVNGRNIFITLLILTSFQFRLIHPHRSRRPGKENGNLRQVLGQIRGRSRSMGEVPLFLRKTGYLSNFATGS